MARGGSEEGRQEGQATERRRNIAAVMAASGMTDEAKLQAIAAINGVQNEESELQIPHR